MSILGLWKANLSSVSRILGLWESSRALWESILGLWNQFWPLRVDFGPKKSMVSIFGPLGVYFLAPGSQFPGNGSQFLAR